VASASDAHDVAVVLDHLDAWASEYVVIDIALAHLGVDGKGVPARPGVVYGSAEGIALPCDLLPDGGAGYSATVPVATPR